MMEFWIVLFLDSRFQNHPDSVILQKHQSLLKQSLKRNSAHMSSLNLTPKLSFEPRFRMLIMSCYYTKKKPLQPLDLTFSFLFNILLIESHISLPVCGHNQSIVALLDFHFRSYLNLFGTNFFPSKEFSSLKCPAPYTV